MKIRVRKRTRDNRSYGLPRCKNAIRACRLVNRDFLTTEELKTLELMGFTIIVEEEDSKSYYDITHRGSYVHKPL